MYVNNSSMNIFVQASQDIAENRNFLSCNLYFFGANQWERWYYWNHLQSMVASPFNHVIILVTSAALSPPPPSFIPTAWNSLSPFIQCGQKWIIKTFWSQGEGKIELMTVLQQILLITSVIVFYRPQRFDTKNCKVCYL